MLLLVLLFLTCSIVFLNADLTDNDILRLGKMLAVIHQDIADIHQDIADLRKDMMEGVRKMHDFANDRAKALGTISWPTDLCGTKMTAHSVFWEGIVGGITAAHYECSDGKIPPKNLVFCDNVRYVDVVIYTGCPPKDITEALNIAHSAQLRPGDSSVAHGFAAILGKPIPRYWQGQLLGAVGEEKMGQCGAGTTNVTVREDEYLISGDQFAGMSGGAVLNGYGYLGTVHAITGIGLAAVIPSSYIKACMTAHRSRFSSAEDCNLTVMLPPKM